MPQINITDKLRIEYVNGFREMFPRESYGVTTYYDNPPEYYKNDPIYALYRTFDKDNIRKYNFDFNEHLKPQHLDNCFFHRSTPDMTQTGVYIVVEIPSIKVYEVVKLPDKVHIKCVYEETILEKYLKG